VCVCEREFVCVLVCVRERVSACACLCVRMYIHTMPLMNESCHISVSHVKYRRVMSHIGMSHVTYRRVMTDVHESCHVCTHWNGPCHTWMRFAVPRVTWVIYDMTESYYVPNGPFRL